MIYSLGCDVAKDEHVVCLIRYNLTEQTWEVISRKSFKNNPSGSKAMVRWVTRLTRKQPAPLRCTLEATGVYYEQLALHLHDHHQSQIKLSVVLPSQAKSYISSRGLRNKTDKIDAFGLALMGAERKLDRWQGIDSYWRTLRQLTRTKATLQKQMTEVRNQLHAQTHSGIQVKSVQQSLKRLIKTMETERDRLIRQIEDHLASRPELQYQIECVDSIPGIGLQTIAVILAETLGFTHFSSYSQLISFSGYDVTANESAKRIGKRKISKKGSPFIRHAMYMPANTVIRTKPKQIYSVYERLVNKHNIKMKAHVAIQKKLLGYIYTLWTKKQMYDPQNIARRRAGLKNEPEIPNPVKKRIAPPSADGRATVDTSHAKAS